jgi:hypothetical protein
VAKEPGLKDAGAIVGNTDMTLYTLIEKLLKLARPLAFQADKQNGQTPLHAAFAAGNLECALWIMASVQNLHGTEALAELLNAVDNVSGGKCSECEGWHARCGLDGVPCG